MIASLTQNNPWMPFKTLNGSLEGAAFVDKFDTFLFDCDGVIWQGNNLIPGVHSVLETLKRLGKRILFVTNNSSKSRTSYLEKFASLGIHTGIDNIFGSSYCAGMRVSVQTAI
jgi:4-nitrophenyl phosphatase